LGMQPSAPSSHATTRLHVMQRNLKCSLHPADVRHFLQVFVELVEDAIFSWRERIT
jgi:hypothetical protein